MPRSYKILTAVIVVIWGICSLIVAWQLPLGTGRDEIFHVQNADFYANEKRLPIVPDDYHDGTTSVQLHQPPFYYTVLAGLLWLGAPDADSMSYYVDNPFGSVTFLQTWDNRLEKPVITWYLMRLISWLFTCVAVYAVYRAAVMLFAKEIPEAVPLTMAFLLLSPGIIVSASLVSNNILMLMFGALMTLLLVHIVQNGTARWSSFLVGALLGLGLLSKLYVAPFAGTIAIILFVMEYKKGWRSVVLHVGLAGLACVLVVGWWYARNQRLYGDLTSAAFIEDVMGTNLDSPMTVERYWTLGKLALGKTWAEGIGPAENQAWPSIVSDLSIWVILVGTLAVIHQRHYKLGLLFYAIVIPMSTMVLYGLSRNIHAAETQWLLRPAVPILCLFLAAGLLLWLPERWRRPTMYSSITVMGVVAAVFLRTTFWSSIAPIGLVDDPADLDVEHHIDIPFENGAHLVGYEIEDNELEVGDKLKVKVCWQAGEDMDTETNYAILVELSLPDQNSPAKYNDFPLAGRYPTVRWEPGKAYCEKLTLPTHATSNIPLAYYLHVGMFIPGGEEIQHETPEGELSNYLLLERVTVYDNVRVPKNLYAQVENWAGLVEANISLDQGRYDLYMDWCALYHSKQDYNYFWHALDEDGEIIGQQDGQILDGKLPTNRWVANTCFLTTISMEAPEGTASFNFGFYELETGYRATWRQNGEIIGDHLTLTPPESEAQSD